MTARSARPANAISILEDDHARLRALLAQLDKTTARGAKKRSELLAKVAHEIRVHAKLEERIFYPAYHEAASKQTDTKLFFEATEEHALVDVLLPQLEEADPTSEVFGAKAKVLKDLVEHHAEEEESEMFPRAKKLLGKAELQTLGEELQSARPNILQGESSKKAAREDSDEHEVRPKSKSAQARNESRMHV